MPIFPTGVSSAFPTPTDSAAGPGIQTLLGAIPPLTNAPIIFEPDPELTQGSTEVWIIASGSTNWGGCQVWVSPDGTTYGVAGIIGQGAIQGLSTMTFPVGTDPDTINGLAVDVTESLSQITSATNLDADEHLTLSYIDGELIAFSTATLTSTYHYNLTSYIRRGCYGTQILPHVSGSKFARVGPSTIAVPYPQDLIGRTLHFKFPAFNTLGAQFQDLSVCVDYTYTLLGTGLEPRLWAQSLSLGSKITDLVVDPFDGNFELFDVPMPVPVTFPVGLVTSTIPGCEVAPVGATSLTLQKITAAGTVSNIGSINYSGGSKVGSYTFTAKQSFAFGDRMRCYAPPSVDATIAGLFGTIVGVRGLPVSPASPTPPAAAAPFGRSMSIQQSGVLSPTVESVIQRQPVRRIFST